MPLLLFLVSTRFSVESRGRFKLVSISSSFSTKRSGADSVLVRVLSIVFSQQAQGESRSTEVTSTRQTSTLTLSISLFLSSLRVDVVDSSRSEHKCVLFNSSQDIR